MSKLIVIAALVFAFYSTNRIEVREANTQEPVRVAAHLSGFHNASMQLDALEVE